MTYCLDHCTQFYIHILTWKDQPNHLLNRLEQKVKFNLPVNVQRLGSLTWAAAHCIPLHTLAKREGGHIGIGVYTLLHVAAPHALGAAASALATRCPQGTWCPALLGTVVCWELSPKWTLVN